jgi:hypothetical protein
MESFAGLTGLVPKARAFAQEYEHSEIAPVASKAKRALKKLAKP